MHNQIKRRFACTQCGMPYEAYPPDDVHTRASTDHCLECPDDFPNETPVNYECDNCHKRNEIFWHDPREHTNWLPTSNNLTQ